MPVFAAYRRGYDPDQVDHYVAEQGERLEAANSRADSAEQKLSSAVQQLREMHRKVTTLEAVERVAPSSPVTEIPVDTLGQHVQRILSEAWEGSQALRREAEQSAAETKERALAEGDRIVAIARRKAESIGEDLARRRHVYLEKLEAERAKAVAQISFLQEQREIAISDLKRVKALLDSTVAEVTSEGRSGPSRSDASEERKEPAPQTTPPPPMMTPRMTPKAQRSEPVLAATMPVHRLAAAESHDPPDPSELVRTHRAQTGSGIDQGGVIRTLPARAPRPSLFDFDAEEDDQR